MNTNWNELAAEIATAMGEDAADCHRGVVSLDDRYVIFGNDDARDPRTVKERQLIRSGCRRLGLRIMGQGTSSDRSAWTMIVEINAIGTVIPDQSRFNDLQDLVTESATAAGFRNAEAQRDCSEGHEHEVIERFAA
jgi:hypothetical protein